MFFNQGQLNTFYLRTQQNMLSALNATRVLHDNQYRLRKVFKYQINALEQFQEQESIEDDFGQQPTLLIQKLLAKATQPSPLKPGFAIEEMQLAALNLSQFLAAEGDFEKPCRIDNDNLVAEELPKAATSELPTPNSECSVKSIVSEKSNKKKKSEESKQEVPVNPIVGPIVEMGFTKKSVEDAIKTLSE